MSGYAKVCECARKGGEEEIGKGTEGGDKQRRGGAAEEGGEARGSMKHNTEASRADTSVERKLVGDT